VIALHRAFGGRAGRLKTIATALGLTGIAAVVVLQLLLITGVLTFEQQVGPVTAALFLGVGGWMLLAGYLGRVTHLMRHGLTLGVLGWSYLGYPVWAFGLGRQLSQKEGEWRGGDAPPHRVG